MKRVFEMGKWKGTPHQFAHLVAADVPLLGAPPHRAPLHHRHSQPRQLQRAGQEDPQRAAADSHIKLGRLGQGIFGGADKIRPGAVGLRRRQTMYIC